jgi:dolichol-phosphate mannosyltransferase
MLFLGLIGEYLGRLFVEAKRRPLFIISDVVRSPGAESDGPQP